MSKYTIQVRDTGKWFGRYEARAYREGHVVAWHDSAVPIEVAKRNKDKAIKILKDLLDYNESLIYKAQRKSRVIREEEYEI